MAKKSKERKPAKHGSAAWWTQVEREYVEGIWDPKRAVLEYPSLDELADKYDKHPTTVRKKSADGNWVAKKEAYTARVLQEYYRTAPQERAKQMSLFDEEARKTLNIFERLRQQWISSHVKRDEDGSIKDVTPPSGREFLDMMKALDIQHKLIRRSLGFPDTVSSQVVDVNVSGNITLDTLLQAPLEGEADEFDALMSQDTTKAAYELESGVVEGEEVKVGE